MKDQDLINRPLVKAWLWWALIWLTIFPIVGVVVSIKLHNPEFLDGVSWLTFGRLRPIHVNGVIFGSFSTVFLGLLYYIVPRVCGVRMYKEAWGWGLLWSWNAFLILGSVSFLFVFNLKRSRRVRMAPESPAGRRCNGCTTRAWPRCSPPATD